jgi:hypothetical protein
LGLGFLKDDLSLFLREVVAHKEDGHNFMTNGRFVIPLIGANGRKTYLNFKPEAAVTKNLCEKLITTSF